MNKSMFVFGACEAAYNSYVDKFGGPPDVLEAHPSAAAILSAEFNVLSGDTVSHITTRIFDIDLVYTPDSPPNAITATGNGGVFNFRARFPIALIPLDAAQTVDAVLKELRL